MGLHTMGRGKKELLLSDLPCSTVEFPLSLFLLVNSITSCVMVMKLQGASRRIKSSSFRALHTIRSSAQPQCTVVQQNHSSCYCCYVILDLSYVSSRNKTMTHRCFYESCRRFRRKREVKCWSELSLWCKKGSRSH